MDYLEAGCPDDRAQAPISVQPRRFPGAVNDIYGSAVQAALLLVGEIVVGYDIIVRMCMANRTEEEVVLVDEENNILGTMPKSFVHGKTTPLHRGFSLFLFGRDGRLLLQRRSHTKKTWPLAWSNSICGHPGRNESNVDAAKRRLAFELRIASAHIEEVAPYRYTFVRSGIMENEICPILVGFTREEPKPSPDEAAAVRWVAWPEFLEEIRARPGLYSEWCVEEARILAGNSHFDEIFRNREMFFKEN